MALIKCPECNHDVSDKALSCPYCGYPITPTSPKPRVKNGRPTKLPNGFGSVYKMPGKRRNPYRATKTDKWIYDEVAGKSKQVRFTIGYYGTREEAMIALSNYNQNPYDVDTDSVTFEEVYQKWSDSHFLKLSNKSSQKTIAAAYAYCKGLYKMRMKDIRAAHLEAIILNAQTGDATKIRIKSLLNMMYRFAIANDICDKDYASLMFANGSPLKRDPQKEAIPFSNEEILLLWDNVNTIPFVDMIIIDVYSGWRPKELISLKVSDIDLNANTMKGGSKTDAGKNRLVPIHPLIKPLIENRIAESISLKSEYLFNDINSYQDTYLTYSKYRKRFDKAMTRLKMSHRPHEARHTFITKAKSCHVDDHILKLIVGHAEKDLTERVYTHRAIEQLQEEIKKITK